MMRRKKKIGLTDFSTSRRHGLRLFLNLISRPNVFKPIFRPSAPSPSPPNTSPSTPLHSHTAPKHRPRTRPAACAPHSQAGAPSPCKCDPCRPRRARRAAARPAGCACCGPRACPVRLRLGRVYLLFRARPWQAATHLARRARALRPQG